MEKYIRRAKHIEVQIIGDKQGNIVHLFERDCSIQRRHQKLIEESPQSFIDDKLKENLYSIAIKAAKAVNYSNAGTVEFIYDMDSHKFYFMEMNTRLQVEHPVTEAITGIDLVEWQLKVASGLSLPKQQSDIKKKGHSIEVRVYSEDPANNFIPCTGTIDYVRNPNNSSQFMLNNNGIRIDSSIKEGDKVSVLFDPLLSKVISLGDSRQEAILNLKNALQEYKVFNL